MNRDVHHALESSAQWFELLAQGKTPKCLGGYVAQAQVCRDALAQIGPAPVLADALERDGYPLDGRAPSEAWHRPQLTPGNAEG